MKFVSGEARVQTQIPDASLWMFSYRVSPFAHKKLTGYFREEGEINATFEPNISQICERFDVKN